MLLFSSISLTAQEFEDYYPFPYDSVFFEPAELNDYTFDALMPLIKSGDEDDMLLPIHNATHWIEISEQGHSAYGLFPFKNWMGEVSYENQTIQFVSAFEDTIQIRTDVALNTTDMIPFTRWENEYTMAITYENLLEIDGDFIKEYSFEIIDGDGILSSFDIETMNFRISKENGILATPSFFYFPHVRQYNYKGKASDILDPNTSNAYKVFHQNPGDEIHSHKSKITSSSSGQNGGQNIYYKTVCVNQDYNEDLQRLIRTSDIWYLENNVAGFNQKKDTLYLDEYTNLNRLLPDGFGADIYENGAFYSSSDNAFFIEGFDDRWEVQNDSLYVTDYIDYMNYNSSWYHLGHRLLYNEGAYFFDWSGSHNSHKPVYTNINGEEWGTPYSDSFLLSLADKESDANKVFLEANNLYLTSDLTFESARIYNTKGDFIKYITGEELKTAISIADLPNGVYILWIWNGEKAFPYKFMKQKN